MAASMVRRFATIRCKPPHFCPISLIRTWLGLRHASEDVGDIRESVAHASRLQAKLDEVAHRLLVGVGDGPAGGLGANGIVPCGLAGVKGLYEGLLRCFCAFSSSRGRKKISATPKFFGVATKFFGVATKCS